MQFNGRFMAYFFSSVPYSPMLLFGSSFAFVVIKFEVYYVLLVRDRDFF